jgi:hypothetical protein
MVQDRINQLWGARLHSHRLARDHSTGPTDDYAIVEDEEGEMTARASVPSSTAR